MPKIAFILNMHDISDTDVYSQRLQIAVFACACP